ncbi:MAG: hypothetical protein FIA97_17815 [Methylococcaceae bacterium]|nr:hypothetical protein [Methylococcaceae bacterium]
MFKFPDRLHLPQFPRVGFHRAPRPRSHRRWWYAALAALLVVSGALEMMTDALVDIGDVLFDLVEENLEAFYRKTAHLDTRGAQMASAYTYLAVAIVLMATLGRRLWRSTAHLVYRAAWLTRDCAARVNHHYRLYAGKAQRWWNSLDSLNKIAVAGAGVLGAIPLFLLLSYGLGAAVAQLL